jgi:hypothetical protein
MLNRLAMFSVEMSVPGTEQAENCERGDPCVGVDPSVAAILSGLRGTASGAMAGGTPAAIGLLVCDKPGERELHGGLGIGSAAARFDDLRAVGRESQLV